MIKRVRKNDKWGRSAAKTVTPLSENCFLLKNAVLQMTHFLTGSMVNDNQKKKLCFNQFSTRTSLDASDLFLCLHNQKALFVPLQHIKEYRCLKIVVHLTKKNKWLLLSARFIAKFELINREIVGSSKKAVPGIFKIALHLKDWYVFM